MFVVVGLDPESPAPVELTLNEVEEVSEALVKSDTVPSLGVGAVPVYGLIVRLAAVKLSDDVALTIINNDCLFHH